MSTRLLGLVLSLMAMTTYASAEDLPADAAQLAHALDRLSGTARVLYVAAHPDDENTRFLSYLVNGRQVAAAYLSMTRGGGGQNLIGREQDELLDLIRTEELRAARKIDGAIQRFTRMRDFGYSKSASETLALWGHDEALADVVFVIRSFQPDVIVTRFDEQPPNHGHHTASAILAREAFTAAADATRFPEQLALGAKPWQARRVINNVPHWRAAPLPADALVLDVGGYDVRRGLSFGEIAALSRTQHKSQGFGVPGERGELLERFVHVAGARAEGDLLDGVDATWSRFGGDGALFAQALDDARKKLHRDVPERALPALLAAHRALAALPDDPRVHDARVELERVIAAAAGVYLRATAARPSAVPGSTVPVRVELLMRRPAGMSLRELRFSDGAVLPVGAALGVNEKKEISHELRVPDDAAVTMPYWLAEPALAARQVVSDAARIGEPEGPPAAWARATLVADGRTIALQVPVNYAWNDRVHGERARRFVITPKATVTPVRNAVLFPNGKKTRVALRVRAAADGVEGKLVLPLPKGWRAEPAAILVELARAGDETTLHFEVKPPARGAESIEVKPAIELDGRSWSYREEVIDYPHIPVQTVLQPARVRLTVLSLAVPKTRVGYVEGSGDTIASDLAHVGVRVELLDDETLREGKLERYSAIVVGIRAYNTRQVLRAAHARLMQYVERGGVVVVQYNTHSSFSPLDLPIGPYPLELGRERVTDENAEMIPLSPKHAALTTPNRIGPADQVGWVQERGLYFASKWDERYEPIFEMGDPGETKHKGALLVARHGRGRYVYTGLSFFRQLPAGVPGAYRLLVNLIAR